MSDSKPGAYKGLTEARKRANKKYNDKFVEIKVRVTPEKRAIMNDPQPTVSDGVSVMPLCGMNLQDLYILQNRACPRCPYPIGLPLGILFLRCLPRH